MNKKYFITCECFIDTKPKDNIPCPENQPKNFRFQKIENRLHNAEQAVSNLRLNAEANKACKNTVRKLVYSVEELEDRVDNLDVFCDKVVRQNGTPDSSMSSNTRPKEQNEYNVNQPEILPDNNNGRSNRIANNEIVEEINESMDYIENWLKDFNISAMSKSSLQKNKRNEKSANISQHSQRLKINNSRELDSSSHRYEQDKSNNKGIDKVDFNQGPGISNPLDVRSENNLLIPNKSMRNQFNPSNRSMSDIGVRTEQNIMNSSQSQLNRRQSGFHRPTIRPGFSAIQKAPTKIDFAEKFIHRDTGESRKQILENSSQNKPNRRQSGFHKPTIRPGFSANQEVLPKTSAIENYNDRSIQNDVFDNMDITSRFSIETTLTNANDSPRTRLYLRTCMELFKDEIKEILHSNSFETGAQNLENFSQNEPNRRQSGVHRLTIGLGSSTNQEVLPKIDGPENLINRDTGEIREQNLENSSQNEPNRRQSGIHRLSIGPGTSTKGLPKIDYTFIDFPVDSNARYSDITAEQMKLIIDDAFERMNMKYGPDWSTIPQKRRDIEKKNKEEDRLLQNESINVAKAIEQSFNKSAEDIKDFYKNIVMKDTHFDNRYDETLNSNNDTIIISSSDDSSTIGWNESRTTGSSDTTWESFSPPRNRSNISSSDNFTSSSDNIEDFSKNTVMKDTHFDNQSDESLNRNNNIITNPDDSPRMILYLSSVMDQFQDTIEKIMNSETGKTEEKKLENSSHNQPNKIQDRLNTSVTSTFSNDSIPSSAFGSSWTQDSSDDTSSDDIKEFKENIVMKDNTFGTQDSP